MVALIHTSLKKSGKIKLKILNTHAYTTSWLFTQSNRLDVLDELEELFVVKFTRQAQIQRDVPMSLFSHHDGAPLVRKSRIQWLSTRCNDNLSEWPERIDEILEDTCLNFKTAYILGGLTFAEIKNWIKPLGSCSASVQRAIFLFDWRPRWPFSVGRHAP